MKRTTLSALGAAVFGLVFASFVVRGVGQLVVGPDLAIRLSLPVTLLAALALVTFLALWLLARLGVVALAD